LKVSVRLTWALSNCRVRLSSLNLLMPLALRRLDRMAWARYGLSASVWW
jgi:hypothetical protein